MKEKQSLARRIAALFGALAVASLAAYGAFGDSTPPDPTQFSFWGHADGAPLDATQFVFFKGIN
ncbi:hypothetical protein [Amycolatopsis pithecellobii]|uniref:Uncharacterized protein n=1 Tax=Amycolatopsis pithecellobii TaxID=664692 RepID=A0A6N7Z5K3_9PSEU|nr:hypothetical protein [Amycolatopsis pithecellobii]MTD55830.1 hypothetical protein [Amycolatopsis pithecellobii]